MRHFIKYPSIIANISHDICIINCLPLRAINHNTVPRVASLIRGPNNTVPGVALPH